MNRNQKVIGLKLGGSDITYKERTAEFPITLKEILERGHQFINFEHIEEIAGVLRAVQASQPGVGLGLVHGVGPFGHKTAHLLPPEEVHQSVAYLNFILRALFEQRGLASVSLSPYELCRVIDDRKTFELASLVEAAVAALDTGKIPVGYGDMAPFKDDPTRYGVVSGDDLLPAICAHPDIHMVRMVMLCKHQLHDRPPATPGARPVEVIEVDEELVEAKLARLKIQIEVDPDEKSEGMLGKVKACYEFTRQTGVVSAIVPFERLEAGLKGETVGTQLIVKS